MDGELVPLAPAACVIHVPLTGGGEAVLTSADHARIVGMGYGGPWFLGRDREGRLHVRACRSDGSAFKPVIVWRHVLRDPTGWRGVVSYLDANPLNLTRGNVSRPARTPGRHRARRRRSRRRSPAAP